MIELFKAEPVIICWLTLNQEYEQWWYDSWFTDDFSEESSELSSEPEESIRNLTSLTEIFQIIPN